GAIRHAATEPRPDSFSRSLAATGATTIDSARTGLITVATTDAVLRPPPLPEAPDEHRREGAGHVALPAHDDRAALERGVVVSAYDHCPRAGSEVLETSADGGDVPSRVRAAATGHRRRESAGDVLNP